MAVIFDSPEKTFRHHEFPDYKATREKMPDEMADQIPYIRKISEAMRIPFIAVPTFEADDIIGTLVRRAETKEIDTFMVSGDKDFYQLLGPRTHLYQTKKGEESEILDEGAAQKKWGIPDRHVTDLLALMGDSSDNVPGVPGVGEKTASKLVQQFGSLENLYRHVDEVEPASLQTTLKEHRALAELSKRLVTIHTDVPVPLGVEELRPNGFDVPRLQALYDELDFHSLIGTLAGHGGERTDTSKEKYILINTRAKFLQFIEDLKKARSFAVDTETTGLHPADAEPIGLSFSFQTKSAYFVPLHSNELSRGEILETLRPILEDERSPKGGQNIKYDRTVLKNAGVRLRGIAFDTMLESYLLDPGGEHGLDALALKHLGIEKIRTQELIGKGSRQISMAEVDLDRLSHYACEDADVTWRLHEKFYPRLQSQDLVRLYEDVELPLAAVLGDMERTGVAVDVTLLKTLSKKIAGRLTELTEKIYAMAGETFNINSPKQLGPLLFERLKIQETVGIKRIKKTKTGYATDQDTLETYAGHPIVALLLEYRNLSKLQSTYTENLPLLVHPKTGRIHTSFNQTVTATGRLSSSDPNLQNIPIRTDLGKEIRKAFIPGENGWKLLSADYSQIELRILAHLSGDKTLIETFKRNEDIHRRTAALVFCVPADQVTSELRGRAKAINFGIIYGMGPQRLARETGISMDEAKAFIEAYFAKYRNVKSFLDSMMEDARKKGYVTTLLGRRRNIPEISSNNPRLVSNAERIAVNTPIQGSAADLIKVAMVRIARTLERKKFRTRMLLQVHDELVFESPEDELQSVTAMVKEAMERAIELCVPIVVDVGAGANWAEAH